MSDRHDWPHEATQEEIRALRPAPEELARRVARHLLEERWSGLLASDVSPKVRLAYRIACALEADPWLQELDENIIEDIEALQLAGEVIAALQVKGGVDDGGL